MGIDRHAARLMLWAHRQGVDFSRPLTIGRMGLHLSPADLSRTLAAFGVSKSKAESTAMLASHQGFAEPFFHLLGAKEPASVDNSPYEGANLIHDMNHPVPDDWHSRYSVVFDGGTLEHVFNFPTALKSCLEMVAVGGHFFSLTPTNNFMGHGFYQFSPELFARVLGEENGFELQKLVLYETTSGRFREVIDPAMVRRRVTLVNDRPTMLFAWAKRTHQTEIFAKPPQQSDYSAKWSDSAAADDSKVRQSCEAANRQKPLLHRWLRGVKKWLRPRFPSRFYKPLSVPA